LIDIGRIGFVLWVVTAYFCAKVQLRSVASSLRHKLNEAPILKAYGIGCVALLVMWIFLHVFEDSMINYTFFVLWGAYLWYIQSKKNA
jgi:uncharacterized protein with PQ loop repeat